MSFTDQEFYIGKTCAQDLEYGSHHRPRNVRKTKSTVCSQNKPNLHCSSVNNIFLNFFFILCKKTRPRSWNKSCSKSIRAFGQDRKILPPAGIIRLHELQNSAAHALRKNNNTAKQINIEQYALAVNCHCIKPKKK